MGIVLATVRSVAWGLTLLILLITLALSLGGGYFSAKDAIGLYGTESMARELLSDVQELTNDFSKLKEAADGEADFSRVVRINDAKNNVESLIKEKIANYCEDVKCVTRYDIGYVDDSNFDDWVGDFVSMLERRSKSDALNEEVSIGLAKLSGFLLSILISAYLLLAFIRYNSLGWKRLLALTVFLSPLMLSILYLSARQIDLVYGHLDLSGGGSGLSMGLVALFPFVFLPPLWVLSRRAGLSISDVFLFRQAQKTPQVK